MDDFRTRHSNLRIRFLFVASLLTLLGSFGALNATATTVITYYHNDAAGTPVVATDETGAVRWRETHLPYGARHSHQADVVAHPLQFTGHSEDPDTGLIDEGARQYDPITAQFTGFDPAPVDADNPHSFTRYGYANNNPYRYADPTGESPVDIAFLAADTLKLSLAIYSGNATAIRTAGVDFAASAVGVIDPIPFSGQALKAAIYAERAKALEKAGSILEKAAHANKIDGRPATLYEKYSKDKEFLKWGVTKHADPAKRYTKKQIAGGQVNIFERGPRNEMIARERQLVETKPGPHNREPWAGRRSTNERN